MSTSWSGPDERRVVTGTGFGRLDEQTETGGVAIRLDLLAGLVTLAVTVLVAAPVGLLWAALAPRVQVVVGADGRPSLVDVYGDGFIADDGYFLGAVLLAGIVGGVLAWVLGRRHGPVVVVALAVGGLLAAYVAMSVGETVDLSSLQTQAQALARSGSQDILPLTARLTSIQALVGWPVGSLLAYLGASLVIGERGPDKVSSD